MVLRGLSVMLVLGGAACSDDRWTAPVLDATAAIELEGGDPATATVHLTARLGELSGTDHGGEHDDSATADFEPFDDRIVTFAPETGDPVQLTGEGEGRYGADVVGYSAGYAVDADGTQVFLPVPPFFTAEVVVPPGGLPFIELSNTDGSTSASVIRIDEPTASLGQATVTHEDVGDLVTFDPAMLEVPGEYQVRIKREDWGNVEDDELAESAWLASDMARRVYFSIAP